MRDVTFLWMWCREGWTNSMRRGRYENIYQENDKGLRKIRRDLSVWATKMSCKELWDSGKMSTCFLPDKNWYEKISKLYIKLYTKPELPAFRENCYQKQDWGSFTTVSGGSLSPTFVPLWGSYIWRGPHLDLVNLQTWQGQFLRLAI